MILEESEPVNIVERGIDSIFDYIDEVYITITHKKEDYPKTSKLIKKLETKYNAKITHCIWEKNFAKARKYAMEQVPQGDDTYLIWMDADDVVTGSELIPEIVNEMHTKNINAAYFEYLYNVDLDKDGNIKNVVVTQDRERIIRHNGEHQWVGDLHEILIEQGESTAKKYKRNDVKWVHLNHHKDENADLDRNIEILEQAMIDDGGKDPRTRFYLARAYTDRASTFLKTKDKEVEAAGWLNMATNLFQLYLNGKGEKGTKDYLEPSGWGEERSVAWASLGEIANLQGQFQAALECFRNAIDEGPHFPNYYFGMSRTYLLLDDFKKAEIWLNLGTAIPTPKTSIVITPKTWKLNALELSYKINLHKLKLERAKEDLEMILNIQPNDQISIERLNSLKGFIRKNKVAQSIMAISKYLESTNEKDKIPYLLRSVPEEINKERFISEMRRQFLPPRRWGQNEIAIICGPGFEEWTPDSIKTGLGGSEEAVVYMSQELTKLGYRVTVYANPGVKEGMYDGVEYLNWFNINQKDSFNILILWRAIGFVDMNPKAKFTLLWAHDVPNNVSFTKERLDKIDKIAVLTEYHKSLFKMKDGDGFVDIPERKFFLTSNGLPDFKLEGKNEK